MGPLFPSLLIFVAGLPVGCDFQIALFRFMNLRNLNQLLSRKISRMKIIEISFCVLWILMMDIIGGDEKYSEPLSEYLRCINV